MCMYNICRVSDLKQVSYGFVFTYFFPIYGKTAIFPLFNTSTSNKICIHDTNRLKL